MPCAAALVTYQPYAVHGMTTLFGNGAGWAPGLGQAEAQLHQALHTCEQQVQQLLDGLRGAPDVPSKMQTTRVERQIKELQAQMRQHIRDLELMAEEQDACVDGAWARRWCMGTGHPSSHACHQLSGALALACHLWAGWQGCSPSNCYCHWWHTWVCKAHRERGSVICRSNDNTAQMVQLQDTKRRLVHRQSTHLYLGTSGVNTTPSACAPLRRCSKRCCHAFS